MSQSDYLKHKRIATELKINELTPVLNSGDYTNYKQFSIENSIVNTKLQYEEIVPTGYKKIFGIVKKVSSCPTFITCTGTHARSNRVAMSTVYFTPKYVPTYVKHPTYEKTPCYCKLSSKTTDDYLCKCKKRHYVVNNNSL